MDYKVLMGVTKVFEQSLFFELILHAKDDGATVETGGRCTNGRVTRFNSVKAETWHEGDTHLYIAGVRLCPRPCDIISRNQADEHCHCVSHRDDHGKSLE